MPIRIRGNSDEAIDTIRAALEPYLTAHEQAEIEIYRRGWMSIYVRIIDPDFRKQSRPKRHDRIWKYFETLSESVLNHLSLLVLVTPDELEDSGSNLEFDNPISPVHDLTA